MGLVIPTFDNIHYYFLLNDCGLTTSEYDLLYTLNFVGIAIGTILYLNFLRNVEVWKLIFTSLVIRVLITVATLINVMRKNIEWGISDLEYNIVLVLLNHANVVCLCILPMTVLLTYVIPKNIEASMFALLTASLQFSNEWGSEMTGSFISHLYGVTNEDLGTKYSQVLIAKIPMILTMLMMINFITLNQDIANLSYKMNQRLYIDIWNTQGDAADDSSNNEEEAGTLSPRWQTQRLS